MYPFTQNTNEENVPRSLPVPYNGIVAPYPPYPNVMPSTGPSVVTQQQLIAEFRNDWMAVPCGIPNCPRGLEYLSTLDQLLIKRKENWTNNKYIIKNSLGQNVYMAIEDTENRAQCCYSSIGMLDIKVFDLYKNGIIHFARSLTDFMLQTIEISLPFGQNIGSVHEEFTWWHPKYTIKGRTGETELYIKGRLRTDINYTIFNTSGTEIGKITKKSRSADDFFTYGDFISLNFPMDLDVKVKAALIGACMLINFCAL